MASSTQTGTYEADQVAYRELWRAQQAAVAAGDRQRADRLDAERRIVLDRIVQAEQQLAAAL